MIRIQIVGLCDSDFSGDNTRLGDAQIVSDEYGNFDVIDGYCGKGATRLIAMLKARGIKNPYLHISHAHYDHYDGIRKIIRDGYFKPRGLYLYNPDSLGDVCSSVCSEKRTLKAIVSEAKARGIPVRYLNNDENIRHGEIFIRVYREQPAYNGNSDAYLNNGSLCYWFPTIKYLTTGDAGVECAKKYGLHPVFCKGGHHGNDFVRVMAIWLKSHGCLYYWDNDYSTTLTDFLMTGREDAQAVGMKVYSVHGDINLIACNGKAHIYKDFTVKSYDCPYDGRNLLKGANATITRRVLRGDAGAGNARMTYLFNRFYNPFSVQGKVDAVVKIANGIKSGAMDYGQNEARIKAIDKELGSGYGQLVQDYINVLFGVRKSL